jgi:hypothetical protein
MFNILPEKMPFKHVLYSLTEDWGLHSQMILRAMPAVA